MIASVCVWVVSNAVAGKLINILGLTVSVSILLYPFLYILADIYTEVYGYSVARFVFWVSACFAVMCLVFYQIIIYIPTADGLPISDQFAYERVFGQTWRVVVGTLLSAFFASFANDYVIAKMKVLTMGKHLWLRTIGSTIASESLDTIVFYPVAFYGIISNDLVIMAMLGGFVIKVVIETVCTPLTYFVVDRLKKIERVDYYDYRTNFNPFKF